MPTEVSMSGGAPWGFRLSGGGTQPLTVSRLTPGGKAALDGIVQGDHIIAINGQQVAGLQLGELMELIKNTGCSLNLTLVADSEVQAAEQAEQDAQEIKADLAEEHEEGLNVEQEVQEPQEVQEVQVVEEPQQDQEIEFYEQEPQEIQANVQCEDGQEMMSKKEYYNLPQYIRKGLRPPKEEPTWKPQVNWLHGKLRLHNKDPAPGAVEAAGEQLRNAVLAQQGPIELKTGPINGKITHAQYNTPLNMYSDPQIVTTLVSQAVASGADINDPNVFNNANNIKVDTDSAVYKRLSHQEKSYQSKQSRSFNILNTLLKHPYEPQNVC
jgi:Ni/Co efflux regulator RcnB